MPAHRHPPPVSVSRHPLPFDPLSAQPLEELFRWIDTPEAGRVELWRKIPAGAFWMGNSEGQGRPQERPRHRVTLIAPFRIGAVPVTNAQFAAFDPGFKSYSWGGVSEGELAYHPAVSVSWNRAMEFCTWLAESFPWAPGARLPTEEEWEYACRAGKQTRYCSGDEESDLDLVGWYGKNSGDRTHRVGEKAANDWGLHDVLGNVWEWTLSPWTSDYAGREAGVDFDPADPAVPLAAGLRVVRGGSCWDTADWTRAAARNHWVGLRNHGFRVVLPPVSAPEAT